MAITEQPKQYISHGKEFSTQKAAEQHDELYEAREQLESVQREFQRLLAESARTADGHPFEFGVLSDYYYVATPFFSKPHIRKLCYSAWSWAVRDGVDRPEVVEIREESNDRDRASSYIPITSLYWDENNARLKLIEETEKWVQQQQKELDELKARDSASR